MTVYEFFNRVEKLITQINDDATLGTNKIGITADQRLDILNANKDQENGTLKLSKIGMLKLNFNSEDIKSEYFVARNE